MRAPVIECGHRKEFSGIGPLSVHAATPFTSILIFRLIPSLCTLIVVHSSFQGMTDMENLPVVSDAAHDAPEIEFVLCDIDFDYSLFQRLKGCGRRGRSQRWRGRSTVCTRFSHVDNREETRGSIFRENSISFGWFSSASEKAPEKVSNSVILYRELFHCSLSKYTSLGWGDLSRPRMAGGRDEEAPPPQPPPSTSTHQVYQQRPYQPHPPNPFSSMMMKKHNVSYLISCSSMESVFTVGHSESERDGEGDITVAVIQWSYSQFFLLKYTRENVFSSWHKYRKMSW